MIESLIIFLEQLADKLERWAREDERAGVPLHKIETKRKLGLECRRMAVEVREQQRRLRVE